MMKQLLLAATLMVSTVAVAAPKPVWQFDDFKMPESVVFDKQRDVIYVSNVNQGPMSEDGNGSVGLIQGDGSQHTVEWVTGLSSPKGLALRGKYLYTADVRELVVINVETGQVTARYPAPEAKVLNGIAFADDGSLFVSDWAGNRIYKLEGQELNVWLESSALESPNGLVVKDGYLYVAAWGANIRANFSTETSGLLKRISLKNKRIEDLRPDQTWMNLDGLHPTASGWLATDFLSGELLTLDHKGGLKKRMKLAQSAADFWLVEEKNLLLVPYLMSNRVAAYRY